MSKDNAIEMKNLKKIKTNHQIDLAVAGVDTMDLGAIFSTFLSSVSHRFLEEFGKYFMFPIAAAASLIRGALAWRHAHLDRHTEGTKKGQMKTGNIVRAMVESVSALFIAAAVIGALGFAAVMGVIAPWIFVGVLGFKTLFSAGSAMFYWGKSTLASTPAQKEKYREKAKGNAVAAVANLFATAAVYLVMLAGHTVFAIFGIAAGVIGTSYVGYQLYKQFASPTTEKKAKAPSAKVPAGKRNTRDIFKGLVKTPARLILGIDVDAKPSIRSTLSSAATSPNVSRNGSTVFSRPSSTASIVVVANGQTNGHTTAAVRRLTH